MTISPDRSSRAEGAMRQGAARRYAVWLTVAVFGVSIASFFVGWHLYKDGTRPRVESGFFDGSVAVYLAAEGEGTPAFVGLTVRPSLPDSRGDQNAIDVQIAIPAATVPGRVRWGLALTGDATLDAAAPSSFGSIPRYEDVDEAGVFAADVAGLFATSSSRAVVVGEFRSMPGSSPAALWANVTLPMANRFLRDAGATYAISTPELGAFADRGVSQQGDITGAAPRGLPESFLTKLRGQDVWSFADRQNFLFEDSDRGGFQEYGTQPSSENVRQWSSAPDADGVETLKVDAMFSRPADQVAQGRDLFVAGLLLSASAGFGIWGLELLLGPERTPLARRRREPSE